MRLRKSYWLLPILVLSCVLFLTASIPDVSTGTWQTWNNMGDVRSGAAAVLLQDGRVLIIGGTNANGPVASADLFGTDGVFSAAAAMLTPRSGHTATVLSDGRVLVTGGTTSGGAAVNTAEIYDPTANSWSAPVTTLDARAGHTASLLSDGRVLLAGGHDSAGNALSSLEIFDPASSQFSSVGAMSVPRMNHAAATLGDGRVLIIGGTADGTTALASIDIYDPSAGTVSMGPVLSTPRMSATATTTLDGKVAVIGGNNGSASGSQDLASAEVFVPATGQISLSASSLAAARSGHQAFLLPKNNAILVLGGSSSGTDLKSAELYYSWADSFQPTGALSVARPGVAGSAIGLDGRLLAAGGTGLASTELYGFATVKTDAADYPPGSIVTISGSGWQPGETVTLTLLESPLIDTHPVMTAVADAFGNIVNNQFSPDEHDVNIRFYLTAVGSSSQAQTTFTDASPNASILVTASPAAALGGSFSITRVQSSNGGTQTSGGTTTQTFGGTQPNTNFSVTSIQSSVNGCTYIGPSTVNGTTGGANSTTTVTLTYQCIAPTTLSVASASGTYGGTTTLSATLTKTSDSSGVSGKSISFTLNGNPVGSATTNGSGLATLSSVSLAGINAGSYPTSVGASFAGDSSFGASSATGSLTVNKADATWTTSPNSKTYGDADPSPLTTGSGNNFVAADNVTATYTRAAGETVAGGPYHITAALGPADVLSNYNITNTGASFTINQRNATWTTNPNSKTYGDGDPSPLTTGSGNNFVAADNVTATYTRAAGETVAGGPYHLTAALGPAAVLNNYNITNTGASFTINQRNATWTTNPNSKTYGDGDPSPLTTGSGSNFVAADNVTATYTRAAGETVGGGPYHITATLSPAAVLDNYNVSNAGADFTINQRNATWTTNPNSKTYGDGDPSPLTTGSGNNFVAADNVTATYTRAAGETVAGGPYHLTAALGPAAVLNNYNITNTGASFTINQRNATWTTNPNSKTYGDGDPSPLTTGSGSNFVAADNVTATYTRAAGETVGGGPYHITATLSPAAVLDNYNVSNAGADFSINPRNATWTTNPNSKTYGDGDPSPLTTGSGSNFVAADNVTATYTRAAGETVGGGPYHITATLGPAAVLNNYNITNTGASFTISARSATWTTNPNSKTYGDGDPSPLTTGSGNNFVAADNVTATYTRAAGETVAGGPYHLTAALGPAAVLNNYNITNTGASFTISARSATWTTNPNSKTYGDGDPSPLTTGSGSNFVAADNVTATYTRAAGETVSGGPYHITATLSPAAALSNYNITNTGANFTINKRDASVTPNAATKTYGTADPVLSGTLPGFLAGDGVTATYTRTAGETVAGSPYTISATLSPIGALVNYNITYNTANFAITPRPVTVAADAKTKVLGAADPPLTYQITSGSLVNGDNFSGSLTRVGGENVGAYAIQQGTLALNSNYNLTYVSAILKIIYASSGACDGDYGHQILQPINFDGSSVFKQKSTVPAKFRVCDASGNSIGTPGVVLSFKLVQTISGTVVDTVDEAVDSTTPDASFRWDPTGQQWIFNMNTKSLNANTTYYYTITLNDGTTITFRYGLK